MLLNIGLAAIIGLFIGWLIARNARPTGPQGEGSNAELLQAALTRLDNERAEARQQQAARDAEHAELNAQQRETIARLTSERDHLAQDHDRAAAALDELREENSRLNNDLGQRQTELATLRTTLDSEQKAAEEKLALLTQARVELSDQFKSVASDILKENSKTFTEQNQQNIGNLLNPLREKFGEFQQKVESLEKEGLTGRTELKSQIEQLRVLNERLSQDATNLVTALKGSSKAQGDWGEFVLESILESSGLRKGHEYRVQESFNRDDRPEDGQKRARLDVIVDLPEGRHLVLDSKVSLNAYNDYCAAQNDTEREAALARHLASVRNHIRDLSQRNYHALYQLNSLDCVIMFLPIEPAFMLALAGDGKLWLEAWDKNVLLVSPSTLLFVLRTVSQLWRQEQQKNNLQDIVRKGGDLYDKLAAFAEDLTKVGKSLDSAKDSYQEAYKKLATGKGNAIRQAEILKSLGVKPTKAIPISLVERSEEDTPLELAASEELSAQP
jgi:DNA recombination protein RmuC